MSKKKWIAGKGQIGETAMNLDTMLRVYRNQFSQEFLRRVEDKTPVDTGLLQSMWDARNTKDDVVISNKTEYAYYVEHGTEKMEPRRMLARTIEEKETIHRIAVERTKKRGNRTPEE